MQIVTGDRISYFIFLLKKLLCLYTIGFCDQGVSWSSSCDELMNFAANIFLKLVSKPRTGIRASNWLVTYWNYALKGEIVTTKQVQLGIEVKA